MSETKARQIVAKLLANAAGVQYGEAAVSLKIHNGAVIEVAHSTVVKARNGAARNGTARDGAKGKCDEGEAD